MLKKILVLFTSLFLALLVTACGDSDSSKTDDNGTTQEDTKNAKKDETTNEESEYGKLKVVNQKKDLNKTVQSVS